MDLSSRLFKKGRARLLNRDLDVVNIVRAARKINNLTKVMLTQNQQSMLESQKCDMVVSGSDTDEENFIWREVNRQRVEFGEAENISLFDANLIKGVLSRQQEADVNMT